MSNEKEKMMARLEEAMKKPDFNPDTFADDFSDSEKQTLAALITDIELCQVIYSAIEGA